MCPNSYIIHANLVSAGTELWHGLNNSRGLRPPVTDYFVATLLGVKHGLLLNYFSKVLPFVKVEYGFGLYSPVARILKKFGDVVDTTR